MTPMPVKSPDKIAVSHSMFFSPWDYIDMPYDDAEQCAAYVHHYRHSQYIIPVPSSTFWLKMVEGCQYNVFYEDCEYLKPHEKTPIRLQRAINPI